VKLKQDSYTAFKMKVSERAFRPSNATKMLYTDEKSTVRRNKRGEGLENNYYIKNKTVTTMSS